MILQQPGGEASEVPFGAGIGAGAEVDIQAFLLSFTNELGDVVVAGEIVSAGAGFMRIPEDIGGDGVEAHGFGHAQAIAPIGARHTLIVHFTSDDLKGFTVEKELAVLSGEISWSGFLCRSCGRNECQGENK